MARSLRLGARSPRAAWLMTGRSTSAPPGSKFENRVSFFTFLFMVSFSLFCLWFRFPYFVRTVVRTIGIVRIGDGRGWLRDTSSPKKIRPQQNLIV